MPPIGGSCYAVNCNFVTAVSNSELSQELARSAATSVKNNIVNVEDALVRDKPSRIFRHASKSPSSNLHKYYIAYGDAPANLSQGICDICSMEFASNFSEPTDATSKNRSYFLSSHSTLTYLLACDAAKCRWILSCWTSHLSAIKYNITYGWTNLLFCDWPNS